jgi:nucleotide-binding universal stress UspA family protein
MDQIKTVMVTTDFSETSKKAFAPAKLLAQRFGARLVVAHVEDNRLPPLVVEYMAVGLEEVQQRQEQHAREELLKLAAEQLGGEVDCDAVVVAGTPHLEIVRLAEERKPDLIVMATHGRGFFSHALIGSTTERVLRHAPCPVLVVRDAKP